MKTNIPLPKFNVGDTILFEIAPKNQFVVSKIEYLIWDNFLKKWFYSVHGFSGKFEENHLNFWFPTEFCK